MNSRRAAVLATAVAAAVTILAAAVGATNLALGALGVAVLALLGYLVLAMRSLTQAVAKAARPVDRRRGKTTSRSNQHSRPGRQGPSPHEVNVVRRLKEIRNAIHRAPGQTAEMIRVYDRVVTHPHPMPELGGWAATPSTMLWMLDRVMSTPVRTVVECGSGTSTVWIATALKGRGGDGCVVALESSDHYADLTRAELERLGLSDFATVVHAPLVDTPLPDGVTQPWFDVSGLVLPGPIDLLFVDGPPGNVARQARYPAFPVLADRLAPGAAVILDDTGRPAEDAIVERWSTEVHAGRALEVSRTVDRSTVLVAKEA